VLLKYPLLCVKRLRDWQQAGVWQKIWLVLWDELGAAGQIGWSHAVIEQGSGLEKLRFVVEPCFDWLFTWRRLRGRYEKHAEIHEAFLILACIMICWNRLAGFC
jgi:transposase